MCPLFVRFFFSCYAAERTKSLFSSLPFPAQPSSSPPNTSNTSLWVAWVGDPLDTEPPTGLVWSGLAWITSTTTKQQQTTTVGPWSWVSHPSLSLSFPLVSSSCRLLPCTCEMTKEKKKEKCSHILSSVCVCIYVSGLWRWSRFFSFTVVFFYIVSVLDRCDTVAYGKWLSFSLFLFPPSFGLHMRMNGKCAQSAAW